MQSVSDDDVRKRLLEKPLRFELAAKCVYSDWEDVTSYGRAFQVMFLFLLSFVVVVVNFLFLRLLLQTLSYRTWLISQRNTKNVRMVA